ncbi:MAG: hypothetical protein NTY06_04545 [Candidatus Gottesmanbacteria bacterium]|nr:hypothetical protein [Candidatus Gottesmanbacteria bacterium]
MYQQNNHSKSSGPFWDYLHRDLPYLLVITVAFLVLVFVNAPSASQWLSGWDNLHPEFSFSLNALRGVSAIWQEYQGLGLIGGHGYAATLPHTLFLWLFSFILPVNLLRSIFTFLMLFIGTIGTYYLTKKFLHTLNPQNTQDSRVNTASLCAAMFSMLNLGTMQNFTIQLEAFIIHFGFLPWLILALWQVLQEPNRKSYILFILVNIAIIPSGFIPPLFVVQVLIIALHIGLHVLYQRSIKSIKQAAIIVGIITCINAFWLVPLAYFSVRNSGDYLHAYNNIQSTEDFILRNQKFGDIASVALIKGFLFEAKEISHLTQPAVLLIGYSCFIIAILGLITLFRKKLTVLSLGTVVAFCLFFLFLATATPPFSWITFTLQRISPIFEQAFRVAFTKFSIAYALFFSVLLGNGIYTLTNYLPSKRHTYIGIIFIVAMIYYALPAYGGFFIYPRIRLTIPPSYFQLFSYLNKQDPDARIMNLPQGWNWGWTPYEWGYSGSGFLWYGIQQPITDRAFDVWSKYNENYYWELVRALFARDYPQFESLLEKYNISWILLDPTVIPYQQNKRVFELAEMDRYLEQSPKLTLEKTFAKLQLYKVTTKQPIKQFITLLNHPINVAPSYPWTNFDRAFLQFGPYINDPTSPPSVYYPFRSLFTQRSSYEQDFNITKTNTSYIFTDTLPVDTHTYNAVIPELLNLERYIPVTLTFTPKPAKNMQVQLDVQPYAVSGLITATPPAKQWSVTVPSSGKILVYLNGSQIITLEDSMKTTIQKTALASLTSKNYLDITGPDGKRTIIDVFIPTIDSKQQKQGILSTKFSVTIPFSTGDMTYDSNDDSNFYNHKINTCQSLLNDTQQSIYREGIQSLIFDTTMSDQCFDIILPNLPQNTGYIAEITSEYISGRALDFALVNNQSKKTDLEVTLPKTQGSATSYFIIPPMQADGLGYSLRFINSSLNKTISRNYLMHVKVTPFPFYWMTSIYFESPSVNNTQGTSQTTVALHTSHTGTWLYTIQIPNNITNNSALVLSQSFHNDWIAVIQTPTFPFLKPVGKHVLVNNWENGWNIDPGTSGIIYIFFWPQLLEFAGFALLPIPFLIICTRRHG